MTSDQPAPVPPPYLRAAYAMAKTLLLLYVATVALELVYTVLTGFFAAGATAVMVRFQQIFSALRELAVLAGLGVGIWLAVKGRGRERKPGLLMAAACLVILLWRVVLTFGVLPLATRMKARGDNEALVSLMSAARFGELLLLALSIGAFVVTLNMLRDPERGGLRWGAQGR